MTAEESGWTLETYRIFTEALRSADKEFQLERDRRYAEVAVEREKALRIKETADVKIKETKETADLAALSLARDIQTYKDEKADKARDLGLSERGAYVTQPQLVSAIEGINGRLDPVIEYISSQKGVVQGSQITMTKIYATIGGSAALFGILAGLVNLFFN